MVPRKLTAELFQAATEYPVVTILGPRRFCNNYLQTHVERALRSLVHVHDLSQFQDLRKLRAGRVRRVVNCASLSNVSSTGLRKWLSALYGGEQRHNIRDVRVFIALSADDIWSELVSVPTVP